MRAAARILAVLFLAGFVVWRGIVPAMTGIETDFPNYYAAARLTAEGGDLSRLYDDAWFQEQIRSFGIDREGKFSPFPPATALVMLPLASFEPLTAQRIWTLFNILVLAACARLVSAMAGKGWLWGLTLILLSGLAAANNFRFGQLYMVVLLSLLFGVTAWERGQPWRGGAAIGAAAAVKLFPGILIVMALLRREWKAAAAGGAALLGVTLGAVWLLGAGLHLEYVSRIAGTHASGMIQNPFTPSFQSFLSLGRRIFVYDAARNPRPAFPSDPAFFVFESVLAGGVLVAAGFALASAGRSGPRSSFRIQAALVILAAMLLAPATATYHFLLLALPVALILSVERPGSAHGRVVAALFCLSGFIPYALFWKFDGGSWMTLLAYPRLWLLCAMFATAVHFAIRMGRTPGAGLE